MLSSQESLAKQMTSVLIKEGEESALMARKKSFKSKESQDNLASRPHNQSNSSPSGISGESSKKIFKCYRCGKIGHIKRFCRAKLQKSNVADKIVEEEDWGKCFVAETKYVDALASINFENDWIVDSSCGHHLREDQSKFSSPRKYDRNEAKFTANIVMVAVPTPAIKPMSPTTSDDEQILSSNSSLIVKNNNSMQHTRSCTIAPELLEKIERLRKEKKGTESRHESVEEFVQ